MLRQLVNDYREQQHDQTDNDDPSATGALLLQPEAQHQAAHRQQRAGVKSPVIDDSQQPGIGLTLSTPVKEVENGGIQR